MDSYRVKNLLKFWKPKLDQWYPEGWFLTGSAYLVEKGLLDRDIHDIDIMTKADHYHGSDPWMDQFNGNLLLDEQSGRGSSVFYDDDGNEILVHKLRVNDIVFDIMYNPVATEDNILEQIIKYKSQLTKREDFDARAKHLEDLSMMYDKASKYIAGELKHHYPYSGEIINYITKYFNPKKLCID